MPLAKTQEAPGLKGLFVGAFFALLLVELLFSCAHFRAGMAQPPQVKELGFTQSRRDRRNSGCSWRSWRLGESPFGCGRRPRWVHRRPAGADSWLVAPPPCLAIGSGFPPARE